MKMMRPGGLELPTFWFVGLGSKSQEPYRCVCYGWAVLKSAP
jgi:hypothetical protein